MTLRQERLDGLLTEAERTDVPNRRPVLRALEREAAFEGDTETRARIAAQLYVQRRKLLRATGGGRHQKQ